MKKFGTKARLFTATLSISAALLAATPSMAQSGNWEYYWATPNSRNVQPLFSSLSSCEAGRTEACGWMGAPCGIDYYVTARVAENLMRFLDQGYSLDVYERSGADPVCYIDGY